MEIFGYIFALILLIGLCFAAAGVTAQRTQSWTKDNSGAVALGFVAPIVFVIYIFVAGYQRNSYHRSRLEAYSFDGIYSVPLGHGYLLSYFDEMPQSSSLGMGAGDSIVDPVSNQIDQIQQQGSVVVGHIHGGATAEEIASPYFALNTSNGSLRRFVNEANMRAALPGIGALQTPDTFFDTVSSKQRSSFFWLAIMCSPFAVLWGVVRLRRSYKQ